MREVFWRRVISHKYGEEEGVWCTRVVSGRYSVGLWKAIRKEWLILNGSLAYQVGSGQRERFWTDKWCGDEPLCESFPALFSISLSKNAWVSDVWNPVGNGDAKGWVKASRGLRQGDPLSHFLFTLVADVLSRLMFRVEELG